MYNKIDGVYPKKLGVGSGVFRIKITVLFLIAGMNAGYAADAYSQSTLLSFTVRNKTIKEVFSEIEKNSEYVFFYHENGLDLDKRVSLNIRKQKIDDVLHSLFESTNIQYVISDRQIVLSRRVEKATPDRTQQAFIVSGSVTDENSDPLPGVNVVIKGTATGVITDTYGRYAISVPNKDASLSFSFMGFENEEVKVFTRTNVDVMMREKVQEFDEVVVVGYGTQKKASVVGAIAQATSEELQRAKGVANLGAALSGQLPGVSVVQTLSEPGNDDPEIYIRGMGSWNGNGQPLILVDGVERRMNDVDINEVESVSVLKDGSATAVYGVRGGDGVILVTTKRGKIGKPVVSVDANISTKLISKLPDKLNSYDQFQFRNDVIEYQLHGRPAGSNWDTYMPYRILQYYKQPQANGLQYLFPDVDWEDVMIKSFPVSYRTNVNVSGGTAFAKYFGSVGFIFDDDLIRTDADPTGRGYKAQNSYERLNFRTNLDLNVTKSTVFSVNLAGWMGNKMNSYGSTTSDNNMFRAFIESSPDQYALLMPDGAYGYNPGMQNARQSPYQSANNGGVQSTRYTNLATDFTLKQALDFVTPGLSASLTFTYDNTFYTTGGVQDGGQARRLYIDPAAIDILEMRNGSYIDENGNFYVKEGYNLMDYMQGYVENQATDHDYDWSRGTPVYESETSSDGERLIRAMYYQATLNYDRRFGRHGVTALAVFKREESARGNAFPRYREDWVGRITYNYSSRYLLEANFGYNGSEQFGPERRFAFFPSGAIGWIPSEEKFMQNIRWLNKLKFRYSLGKVGNDVFDSNRWAYRTNWEKGSDRTRFGESTVGNSPYVQYYESGVGNELLGWETAVKQNLGVEIGLFKNRIGLSLDLFKDHRTGIFMSASDRTIPAYFGQSAVAANIGETKIKGYEFELSLKNTFANGLYAFFNLTHTGAFDEVVYMEDAPLLPDYKKNAGYPISQTRVQLDAGYVNNWDDVYSATGFSTGNSERMPGEYRIVDFNGDGIIDSDDTVPYAYPRNRPQHTYGFTLGGEYKGFNLTLQFYGVYNITRQYGDVVYPFFNQLNTGAVLKEFANNSWTPDNTSAKYRALVIGMVNAQSSGTFLIEDGSYLRLKTAEIGYTLRNLDGKYLGVSSIRFYLNGTNLFLWNKMIDDREGQSSGLIYPLVRRINLGMNVKF